MDCTLCTITFKTLEIYQDLDLLGFSRMAPARNIWAFNGASQFNLHWQQAVNLKALHLKALKNIYCTVLRH